MARPALCRRTSAPPGAAASNTTASAVPEGSVWVVRFQPARQACALTHTLTLSAIRLVAGLPNRTCPS
eukprot:6179786-Pleurochrysis_carterae.AAC.1